MSGGKSKKRASFGAVVALALLAACGNQSETSLDALTAQQIFDTW